MFTETKHQKTRESLNEYRLNKYRLNKNPAFDWKEIYVNKNKTSLFPTLIKIDWGSELTEKNPNLHLLFREEKLIMNKNRYNYEKMKQDMKNSDFFGELITAFNQKFNQN
jgi:hypothetical protein